MLGFTLPSQSCFPVQLWKRQFASGMETSKHSHPFASYAGSQSASSTIQPCATTLSSGVSWCTRCADWHLEIKAEWVQVKLGHRLIPLILSCLIFVVIHVQSLHFSQGIADNIFSCDDSKQFRNTCTGIYQGLSVGTLSMVFPRLCFQAVQKMVSPSELSLRLSKKVR